MESISSTSRLSFAILHLLSDAVAAMTPFLVHVFRILYETQYGHRDLPTLRLILQINPAPIYVLPLSLPRHRAPLQASICVNSSLARET